MRNISSFLHNIYCAVGSQNLRLYRLELTYLLALFLTFLTSKMNYTYNGDCMIYLDLVVLIDLLTNYLVMISTGIVLIRKTKFKRVFLSSVIGCISLVFLFMGINKIELFIINILISIIMSIIAFNYKDISYTIKNILYMYFISIFLSGGIYLINTNFFPKLNNQIISFIILITISPILTIIYLKSFKRIKEINSNYYQVDIYLKDKPMFTVNGYLDTGNKLSDQYTGKPIILISKKNFDYKPKKIIFVPYNTIDNHGMLSCFSPEKINIHGIGIRKKVLIALIEEVPIENAQCILNKKLLERI